MSLMGDETEEELPPPGAEGNALEGEGDVESEGIETPNEDPSGRMVRSPLMNLKKKRKSLPGAV